MTDEEKMAVGVYLVAFKVSSTEPFVRQYLSHLFDGGSSPIRRHLVIEKNMLTEKQSITFEHPNAPLYREMLTDLINRDTTFFFPPAYKDLIYDDIYLSLYPPKEREERNFYRNLDRTPLFTIQQRKDLLNTSATLLMTEKISGMAQFSFGRDEKATLF